MSGLRLSVLFGHHGRVADAVAAPGFLQQAWWAASLVFDAGLMAAAVWFLAVRSRRSAQTARAEAFRGPARVLVFGWLLLAAGGFVARAVSRPGSVPAGWAIILPFPLLAVAVYVVWRGRRGVAEAADPAPGKHEKPGSPPDSGRSTRGRFLR